MNPRVFIDRTGTRWTVSEASAPATPPERRERRAQPRSKKRVVPKTQRLSTRPLTLTTLLFESLAETRRLTPAPDAWHTLRDDELEDLLLRATMERPD